MFIMKELETMYKLLTEIKQTLTVGYNISSFQVPQFPNYHLPENPDSYRKIVKIPILCEVSKLLANKKNFQSKFLSIDINVFK